jgi:hypothetical protein
MLPQITDQKPAWLDGVKAGTYTPNPQDLVVLLDSLNAAEIGELINVEPTEEVLLTKVVKVTESGGLSALPADVGNFKQSYNNPLVYALVAMRMLKTDITSHRTLRAPPVAIQLAVMKTALTTGCFLFPNVNWGNDDYIAYILGILACGRQGMPIKYLRKIAGKRWDQIWEKVGKLTSDRPRPLEKWKVVDQALKANPPKWDAFIKEQDAWAVIMATNREEIPTLKKRGLEEKKYREALASMKTMIEKGGMDETTAWCLRRLIPCCESKEDCVWLLDIVELTAGTKYKDTISDRARKQMFKIDQLRL